jgi:hypothetical protein
VLTGGVCDGDGDGDGGVGARLPYLERVKQRHGRGRRGGGGGEAGIEVGPSDKVPRELQSATVSPSAIVRGMACRTVSIEATVPGSWRSEVKRSWSRFNGGGVEPIGAGGPASDGGQDLPVEA